MMQFKISKIKGKPGKAGSGYSSTTIFSVLHNTIRGLTFIMEIMSVTKSNHENN